MAARLADWPGIAQALRAVAAGLRERFQEAEAAALDEMAEELEAAWEEERNPPRSDVVPVQKPDEDETTATVTSEGVAAEYAGGRFKRNTHNTPDPVSSSWNRPRSKLGCMLPSLASAYFFPPAHVGLN